MARFRVNFAYSKPNTNSKSATSKTITCNSGLEAMLIVKSQYPNHNVEFRGITPV